MEWREEGGTCVWGSTPLVGACTVSEQRINMSQRRAENVGEKGGLRGVKMLMLVLVIMCSWRERGQRTETSLTNVAL